MNNIISIKNSALLAARNWYHELSQREKVLLKGGSAVCLVLLLWFSVEKTIEYRKTFTTKVKNSAEAIPQVTTLANRVKGLETRKNDLTTLYLNSTLSYQELTSYLDKIIKSKIGNDTYTLNKSSETESIGQDFNLQKFTIKINETTLPSIVELLHTLETGTPRMFIQRTDIVKNRSKETLSLTIELASVQGK